MKNAMELLQLEIGNWQDKTSPKADALSKMSHLAKEIIELNNALLGTSRMFPTNTREGIAEELADCQHLLFGIASKCGINLYDATRRKFDINKKRKWGKPDKNGVVEHIKEQ
jgi:NTP pyrophosphatase (non-canonical NTP hydrolase)